MQTNQTSVPFHVRRVIETTVQQNPKAGRREVTHAVQAATFCEPNQAIDWVGAAFRVGK